jgi:uncharacterized repeat protein (TIGR03809 family)
MTHRIDVAHSRDIAARWCVLAEQRLDYLTELFETGRWRRYHSEGSFLENIREAKTAVETWRVLAGPEYSAAEISLHVSDEAVPGEDEAVPGENALAEPADLFSPQPTDISVESPLFDVSMSAGTDHVYSDEAPSEPISEEPAMNDLPELMLDLDAIERRYPLLRNAL